MKRFLLITLLAMTCFLLQAQRVIKDIVISYDNPIVTRVAIELSEKAPWSYSITKDTHVISLLIKDCDVGDPPVSGLNKSNLLTKMYMQNTLNGGNVILTLNGPFLIETMSVDNPYKIVLDLFVYKKNYSFQEYLYQAEFYQKSGFWTKANKEFGLMQKAYPNNPDVFYHWGMMFVNQKKTDSAIEKLKEVPKTSQYYQSAQNTLSKLQYKPAPETKNKAETEAEEEQDTLLVNVRKNSPKPKGVTIKPEDIKIQFFSFRTFFGLSWDEFVKTRFMTIIRGLPIWFWVIVVVVILIIVLVILDVKSLLLSKAARKRKKAEKKADDPIKQEMVISLLKKDWKADEIARELMLTPKQTHLYIKLGKKSLAKK